MLRYVLSGAPCLFFFLTFDHHLLAYKEPGYVICEALSILGLFCLFTPPSKQEPRQPLVTGGTMPKALILLGSHPSVVILLN